jgi:mRNA interferase RelE/StbE
VTYRIETTKAFDKHLARLPVSVQTRILERVRRVAENPYAPDPNLTKLQGREGYRLRVGDYRVVYALYSVF